MTQVVTFRHGLFRGYARQGAPSNEISGGKYNFREYL
jgi:hypothetical protein